MQYLIFFLVGLGLCYGGCQLYNKSDAMVSPQTVEFLDDLCANGVEATAVLQDEYIEEQQDGEAVGYQMTYQHEVDGQPYTFTRKYETLEEVTPTVSLHYKAGDPNRHSIEDPCLRVAGYRAAGTEIGEQPWYHWPSIIAMGIGALLAYTGFRNGLATLIRGGGR